MKLKSLLLGSAAAMIAVSGANAADAVFAAEPEPMEYVKVCETYGSGFFYIPGTETCLKFSGYVRSEFIYTDDGSKTDKTTDWKWRARLNVDARNETDWGTLRSQLRIQSDGRGGADGEAGIDRALISIGGLRLGYSDMFMSTHHDYGWQLFADDGPFGYDQAVFLDYTFTAAGFDATVGVQDKSSTAAVSTDADAYDPYGGLSYSGSWGKIAGSVLNDSVASEVVWKVSGDITAIENLRIRGWYMADDGGTTYIDGNGKFQWGVSAQYTVNSQFKVAVAYSDKDADDAQRYGIAAHWDPVPGLSFRPEGIFGDDYTQARLRVVRSF